MAFASFDRRPASAPIAEINMVPLIDVMLVLLVIFMITAPLLTHAVRIDLPRTDVRTEHPPVDKIDFAIDAEGQRFWNGISVDRAEAARRLEVDARRQPQPEIHLRADHAVPYRVVAETLADAASAGILKIGFVSRPAER